MEQQQRKSEVGVGGDISVLPEGCISKILSLTCPKDACTSSAVSVTFKSAADGDSVWEQFLPADYREVAAKAVPPVDLSKFETKKELYLWFCDHPLVIDQGIKSLNLDKPTGKKCIMVAATELSIIWGNNPQYWAWTSDEQSRFARVAKLLNVCWLLIEGTIHTRDLSPKTTYVVYIVVKFNENTYGLDYPHAQVVVKFAGAGGIASGTRSVYLDPECNRRPQMQFPVHRVGLIRRRFGHIIRPVTVPLSEAPVKYEGQFPHGRGDGWMEVELGEFYNDGGENREVEVALAETKSGQWKSGLVVQGIEVRPKKIVAEKA